MGRQATRGSVSKLRMTRLHVRFGVGTWFFVPHAHRTCFSPFFFFRAQFQLLRLLRREWLDPRGGFPAGPSTAYRFMRAYEIRRRRRRLESAKQSARRS